MLHENGSTFFPRSVCVHICSKLSLTCDTVMMLSDHINCLKAENYLPKFGQKDPLLEELFCDFWTEKNIIHMVCTTMKKPP